jgi:hypothetical protein
MAFLDWWLPEEPLQIGEEERSGYLANHSVSAWRAVGGKLIATNRRLMFRPNRIDRSLGGKLWTVYFHDVAAVGKIGPTFGLFNGGMVSRLEIRTNDGSSHRFVVSNLDSVVAELERLRLA